MSREQAFQDMWSRCFENISTNTKMMWKDGGNSEVLHSSNVSLRRVTVFSECSNTVWAYNPIFYISKVCLCTTNYHLYHKDPCPERGLNHSKVVIIIYPLSYFKIVSKKQDYSGIPSFRVFDDEKGCPNMYFK